MASEQVVEPGQTLLERVQDFLSEHKRAILIGTAIVAAGGIAYYASTSGGSGADSDSPKRVKDKKKKKKGKKATKDADGPILEEKASKPKVDPVPDLSDPSLEVPELAALTIEERTEKAAYLKAKGNTAYTARKFELAAELYTRAIAVTPKPEPVFFANRAACYLNFPTPDPEKAIADCDEALKMDPEYIKVLNRRGATLESLGRYMEALNDFTAITILEKFRNPQVSAAAERVAKKFADDETLRIMTERGPRLPPTSYLEAYFDAFRPQPDLQYPESPSTGDNTLRMALGAFSAHDYIHAMTLVGEALEQGISFAEGAARAYNLRGSLTFLSGDLKAAAADLRKAVEAMPSDTQSWVKLASVYTEQQDSDNTLLCFEEATKQNRLDPDIYYHKGQIMFINSQYDEAIDLYTKSIDLDSTFVFGHIQLAVAQYKGGNKASSMATFRRTMKQFPSRSEPQNYYGEVLLDQQRYQDAIEKFDYVIEHEKDKNERLVATALVNKGVALLQWKQDPSAQDLIVRALELDPGNEVAVATLSQLYLNSGNLEEACKMFEKQIEIARNPAELNNALGFKAALESQLVFMKNYPKQAKEYIEMMHQRAQMAQGLSMPV